MSAQLSLLNPLSGPRAHLLNFRKPESQTQIERADVKSQAHLQLGHSFVTSTSYLDLSSRLYL